MNEADRQWLHFDLEDMNIKKALTSSLIGMRASLMMDPIETIPVGKKRMEILKIVHYFTLTAFYAFLCWAIFKILFV